MINEESFNSKNLFINLELFDDFFHFAIIYVVEIAVVERRWFESSSHHRRFFEPLHFFIVHFDLLIRFCQQLSVLF